MSTGENFYLTALNIQTQASLAELPGESSTLPEWITADSDATIHIPLNLAQHMFQYWTDAIDIDNLESDDVKFRMVFPSDYVSSDKLYFAENICSADGVVDEIKKIPYYGTSSKNTVKDDFLRYIAREIFGTGNAVDLFNNEEEVTAALQSSSKAALYARLSKLVSLVSESHLTSGIENRAYTALDASGSSVLETGYDVNALAEDLTNFPSKLIFNQLIGLAATASRFSSLVGMEVVAGDNWRKLPLLEGDALFFKLTILPATGQNEIVTPNIDGDAVEAGINNIKPYSYRIKMIIDNTESYYSDWVIPSV